MLAGPALQHGHRLQLVKLDDRAPSEGHEEGLPGSQPRSLARMKLACLCTHFLVSGYHNMTITETVIPLGRGRRATTGAVVPSCPSKV
jgi:hypothetical protein